MAALGRLRRRPTSLDFGRLGEFQNVFPPDTETSDNAVHLGVSKQELNSAQVASLPVDLRNLCPPHGMGSLRARLQPN